MRVPLLRRLGRRSPAIIAGLALASAGFANLAPTTTALAAGCTNGANGTTLPGNSTYNPQEVVNAVVAPIDNPSPRPWGHICSMSMAMSGGNLVATLTVGGTQPAWPDLNSGDSAIQYEVCGDVSSPLASAPQNIDTSGGTIYDGPYPPEEGWKACGLATFGVSPDMGVTFQDPNGNSTFLDATNNHLAGASDSWSGNTVTLTIPSTWAFSTQPGLLDDKAGLLAGLTGLELGTDQRAITESETVFCGGCLPGGKSVQNITAEAFSTVAVGVPNPPGKVCDPVFGAGGPIGCVGELATLGVLVDFAPGGEWGDPGSGVHQTPEATGGLGYDLGLDPAEEPGAQALISCVNPPTGDDGVENLTWCGAVTTGPNSSDLCRPGSGASTEGSDGTIYDLLESVDNVHNLGLAPTVCGALDPVTSKGVSAGVYVYTQGRITGHDFPPVAAFGGSYHVSNVYIHDNVSA